MPIPGSAHCGCCVMAERADADDCSDERNHRASRRIFAEQARRGKRCARQGPTGAGGRTSCHLQDKAAARRGKLAGWFPTWKDPRLSTAREVWFSVRMALFSIQSKCSDMAANTHPAVPYRHFPLALVFYRFRSPTRLTQVLSARPYKPAGEGSFLQAAPPRPIDFGLYQPHLIASVSCRAT